MKRQWPFTALLVLLGLPFAAANGGSDQIRIKLGTLAPKGTAHHQILLRLKQQWSETSGGRIKLVLYTDGVAGSEDAMVQRMRINQLQAGLLSANGLRKIEPGVMGLQSIPLLFRDLDEVAHVRRQLRPLLDQRLSDRGFVTLFWSDTGWVRFFSRQPVLAPGDLQRQKLFALAGDNDAVLLARGLGFQPVVLEAADIYTALQSGMMDAVAMPPFYALATRIYRLAPNMLQLNYAPLVGAAVVRKDVWQRIPAEIRPELLRQAEKAGLEITAAGRAESARAVATMADKWGLNVTTPSAEQALQWQQMMTSIHAEIRGSIVPADIYDQVQEILYEYRHQ